jgi:hypothetical protein
MLEAVEQGASRLSKGFVAGMADLLAFGVRMDTNSVTCAAIGLGAYYQFRAHWWERVFCHTAQLTPMCPVLSNQTPAYSAALPLGVLVVKKLF